MTPRLLRVALAALTAVMILASLLAPWWAAEMTMNSTPDSEFAGPFNPGGGDETMITTAQATTTGIIAVFALIGAAFAATALWTGSPRLRLASPVALLLSGVAMLVAGILAWQTWPSDDVAFWDSQSVSMFGFSMTLSVWASGGWYLALLSGVLGIAGGLLLQFDASQDVTEPTAGEAQPEAVES